jgi:hypothetical protein
MVRPRLTIFLASFKLYSSYCVHFIHAEFSHALACKMTGGKVTGIEVKSNEGGVTKYVGGWRICIIPAGALSISIMLNFVSIINIISFTTHT